MNITVETVNQGKPISVMRVVGRFDASTADVFNEQAEALVKSGATDVLLDLAGVEFISSIGVRSIGAFYDSLHPGTEEEKKAVHQGIRSGEYKAPHLKLLNPSPRVMELIHIISLDMYLDIFTNEKKALAAF